MAEAPFNPAEFSGTVTVDQAAAPALATNQPYVFGTNTRRNSDFQPLRLSADAAIGMGWDLLTRRSRWMVENDQGIAAATNALVDHVVGGDGINIRAAVQLGPDAGGRDGVGPMRPFDEFNRTIDSLWEEYRQGECDAAGRLDLAAMQEIIIRQLPASGEAILLRVDDPNPDRLVPVCWQLLDAEQLDTTRTISAAPGKNRVYRGIETDALGRPVAYYLWDVHPNGPDPNPGTSRRVDAARVIHYFCPTAANQTRGINIWPASMQPARDMDWWVSNILTAAAVQAIFTTMIKRGHYGSPSISGAGGGIGAGPDGGSQIALGSGLIFEGGPDDTIETIQPSHPAASAPEFARLLMGRQAMSCGMSPLALTRDFSQTNYSSARAAGNVDERHFRKMQLHFGRHVVARIWREFVVQAVVLRRVASISAQQFEAQRRRFTRYELALPAVRQIDPEKETAGIIARIGANLSTLKEECGRLGKDWRDVLEQRAAEVAEMERLGLTPSAADPQMVAALMGPPEPEDEDQRDPEDDAEDEDRRGAPGRRRR